METYHFGNLMGNTILFWILAVIFIFLGIVAYKVCSCPSWRREKFRRLGASRKLGIILGGGIVALGLTVTYFSYWNDFYRIDVEGDTLHLRYFLPRRTVDIPRSQIKNLKPGISMSKGNDLQLAICTRDGCVYNSADIDERTYEKHTGSLRKFWHSRGD